MPPVSIIDTHVHLWDPALFPLDWVAGDLTLDQRYSAAEFRAHTEGLPVDGMVFVQADVAASYGLAEAYWVGQLAAQEPRLRGIVAYAPVEQGARLRPFLDALVATGPLVRGVRRLIQGEADASICLADDFVQGVQMLGDYGLSFDLCIRHQQLPEATELVRRCPGTQFMLDHIGKPAIAAAELEPWREQLAALAALPNVCCKISGLATEADTATWQASDLAPYVQHVLAVFGEDRVAFGGDWPVALLATSYRRWVETLDTLTSGLPEAARRKLWAENATRFYRL